MVLVSNTRFSRSSSRQHCFTPTWPTPVPKSSPNSDLVCFLSAIFISPSCPVSFERQGKQSFWTKILRIKTSTSEPFLKHKKCLQRLGRLKSKFEAEVGNVLRTWFEKSAWMKAAHKHCYPQWDVGNRWCRKTWTDTMKIEKINV